MLDGRRELERIARPHDDVRHLARLQRAVAVRHSKGLGGRQRHRAQRLIPRHPVRHRVSRLLPQVPGVVRVGLQQDDFHPRARQHRGVLVADAEGIVGGDVVQRLDEHRDAGARNLVGDLPRLLRAREDELQPELPADAQRGLDVAAAVRHRDQRQLAAQHRQQGLEIGRRG